MKIVIKPFSKTWKTQFDLIKTEIDLQLSHQKIIIEHIGSTSVENLSAKPIIDIMIGVIDDDDLDSTINPLINLGYIYYETYNTIMPNRRFFVKLINHKNNKFYKSVYSIDDKLPHEEINNLRHAHIHVWKYNSRDWIRHIAVREYLRNNSEIKAKYQKLKIKLSELNWTDGIDYNNGKNKFSYNWMFG